MQSLLHQKGAHGVSSRAKLELTVKPIRRYTSTASTQTTQTPFLLPPSPPPTTPPPPHTRTRTHPTPPSTTHPHSHPTPQARTRTHARTPGPSDGFQLGFPEEGWNGAGSGDPEGEVHGGGKGVHDGRRGAQLLLRGKHQGCIREHAVEMVHCFVGQGGGAGIGEGLTE